MGSAQRGFSLIETAVATAIAAILLVAGGIWMLGTHPGALRSGVDGVDAALAAARSIAASSGNGATITFLPRAHGGFVVRVFSGRPTAAGAVHATNVLAMTSDAIVHEQTYGAPPFALFLSSAGHPSGAASYPQVDSAGNPSFTVLSAQPPCPVGGVVLRITSPQGAPSETRTLSCDSSASMASAANPSPTPNVPILTPKALLAHWTSDSSALQFVATEWGYAHWFASATGMQCGSVATYPTGSPYSTPQNAAEALATPLPPILAAYSFPNAGGGSMNDAPAAFRLAPIAGTPGLCTADIVDAFGQHATTGVQVMGDLTSSAASLTFASPSAAAQTVSFSKVYDNDPTGIQLRFGGNCAQVIAYPPPITARRVAGSISGVDASSTTISILPNGTMAAHCSLLVSDQYGEPPVTLPIAIGHPPMRSWPLAVKYAQSGQTFLASSDTTRDPIAFINRMFGGAVANAATPCKAQAFSDPGTFASPDASPPSNVLNQLRSLGATVNAFGCFVASKDGVTPVNAPLTVWEPDGSTRTYNPQSQGCGLLIRTGQWSPSRTFPIASLDTAGGNGSGTCNIAIDDGSGATLSYGNGLVSTQVAAPQNYTISWSWTFTCTVVGMPPMPSYKCNGSVKMGARMPDGTSIAGCGGNGGFQGTFDPSGYTGDGNAAGASAFTTASPHAWASWFQTAVSDAMNDAQNFAPSNTFYNPSSGATTTGCP